MVGELSNNTLSLSSSRSHIYLSIYPPTYIYVYNLLRFFRSVARSSIDRFDRPIRLNVRPLQLASAPFHHSSPLKSPPPPCSFHPSQQSQLPLLTPNPVLTRFHYSFLFKSPFRSQAFPARFCLIPRFQEIY